MILKSSKLIHQVLLAKDHPFLPASALPWVNEASLIHTKYNIHTFIPVPMLQLPQQAERPSLGAQTDLYAHEQHLALLAWPLLVVRLKLDTEHSQEHDQG